MGGHIAMMDEEMKQEWLQEMAQEAREEEYFEYRLRSDYDFFIKHFEDEIVEAQEAYIRLSKLNKNLAEIYEDYGWEFDIEEIV